MAEYKRITINGKERVAVYINGKIDCLLRSDEIEAIKHLISEE